MLADDADLDAITRAFFAERNHVRDALEVRRAVEEAPPLEPSIIPMPEYPRRWPQLIAGVVRYPCTEPGGWCTWAYDVDTLLEDSAPLTFPVAGSLLELERHITERAERRLTSLRERIEEAFRDHFRRGHPGQEPPDQAPR